MSDFSLCIPTFRYLFFRFAHFPYLYLITYTNALYIIIIIYKCYVLLLKFYTPKYCTRYMSNLLQTFLYLWILQESLTETRSNLNYLQTVKDTCIDMYGIESLSDILPILPNLFLQFIFIFEESLYYNKM